VNKKPSLVQIAKRLRTRKPGKKYSKEEKELVIAWLNGEITLTQVKLAKRLSSVTQAYVFVSLVSRAIWR
jgi:hypothetical protein